MENPDHNVAEQLEIADYIKRMEAEGYAHNVPAIAIQATRLAELVQEMTAWLQSGGSLPEAWKKRRR